MLVMTRVMEVALQESNFLLCACDTTSLFLEQDLCWNLLLHPPQLWVSQPSLQWQG